MRNIFLFIRRHFNLILFLFLQVFSLLLIHRYSKYHQAVFGAVINEFTAGVSGNVASVKQYFHLKQTNDSLVKVNERLYNQLRNNYAIVPADYKVVIDSMQLDSTHVKYRKFSYLSATAVSNTVAFQNNFIVIDRGSADAIKSGMGVVNHQNAPIGIVVDVSTHYAVVMSLLHKDSHISGRTSRGGESGTLSWDGISPHLLSITGIPKSAKVYNGDTIQTSGFSTAFPRGLNIGNVTEVLKETSSSNYKLNFKPTADFNNLQYVYVIKNVDMEGVAEVLKKVSNINE